MATKMLGLLISITLVICPICKDLMTKSKVYPLDLTCYCYAINCLSDDYYDESGNYHPNTIKCNPCMCSADYECSEGHKFYKEDVENEGIQ